MKRQLSLGTPKYLFALSFTHILFLRILDLTNSKADYKAFHDACLPAHYGPQEELINDETSLLAREMRPEAFGLNFDPLEPANGILSGISRLIDATITAKLYKIHSYGPGSMLKAHQDTQRGENHLGMLVVALPSRFNGGKLILRKSGEEVTFNWSTSGRKGHLHDLHWVFFSDIEQEILPVKTGYRLTVSYHIFEVRGPSIPEGDDGRYEDDEGQDEADEGQEGIPTGNLNLQYKLTPLFSSLISSYKNRKFLPNGGRLVFCLDHEYGVAGKSKVKFLDDYYKGKDAVLVSTLKAMGLSYRFKAVYEVDDGRGHPHPDKFASAPNDYSIFLIWDDFSGCVDWFQLSCHDADKGHRVYPDSWNEVTVPQFEEEGAQVDHALVWVNRPPRYGVARRFVGPGHKPDVESIKVAAGVIVEIPAFGTRRRNGKFP